LKVLSEVKTLVCLQGVGVKLSSTVSHVVRHEEFSLSHQVIWWGKILVSMKVIVCVCDVKGVLALKIL